MIVALFITIAVLSMPIVAIVVVTMASHREDAERSLGDPAHGVVQATARRLLDFHSEDPAWPLPKSCGQATPTVPALPSAAPVSARRGSVGRGSVAHPRGRTVTDAPRPAATSKISVGTAA